MSSPGQRLARYTYGLSPTRIKDIITAAKPAMIVRFGSTLELLAAYWPLVQAAIEPFGVPPYKTALYWAFAEKLFALARGNIGQTLAIAAQAAIDEFVEKGLSEAVCMAIRTDVFNIELATPAPCYLHVSTAAPDASVTSGVTILGPADGSALDITVDFTTVTVKADGYVDYPIALADLQAGFHYYFTISMVET